MDTVELPFIVVGTARTGGQTLWKQLCDAGVEATCAKIFSNHGQDVAVTKRLENDRSSVEVSWYASPYLRTSALIRRSAIVHLMRNPWNTLHSLVTNPIFGIPDAYGERACADIFVEKHCPLVFQHKDINNQAAEYLVSWDEMLMQVYAARTLICHRIEDDPNELFERMRNIQQTKKWDTIFPKVQIGSVAWKELNYPVIHPDEFYLIPRLKYELFRIADRWGYL